MSALHREVHGKTVLLRLARARTHNSLDHELVLSLIDALAAASQDSKIEALVLTGEGGKSFSAGVDMKMLVDLSHADAAAFLADTRRLFRELAELDMPTIAAINGHCHGGGAEIACACDLRVGCEHTTFRFPGVAYGMAVGTWHLPAVVGLPKAKELLFTAQAIDARQCLEVGLLNRLVSANELKQTALDLAASITRHPPAAVRSVKSLLNRTVGAPLQQRFYRELYSNQDRGVNRDVQEHMRRFLEDNT